MNRPYEKFQKQEHTEDGRDDKPEVILLTIENVMGFVIVSPLLWLADQFHLWEGRTTD